MSGGSTNGPIRWKYFRRVMPGDSAGPADNAVKTPPHNYYHFINMDADRQSAL